MEITISVSGFSPSKNSCLSASYFLARQGITETTTRFLLSTPSSFENIFLATDENICIGDFALDGISSISEKLCSKKFTQAGQQEVRSGNFTVGSPFLYLVSLSRSSEASSMIVRSAAKSVSKTLSNPNFLRAATIFPVTFVPGGISNSSPSAALTAGAVCTITFFLEWANAERTSHVASLSTNAPVGHTATHCPQYVHTESFKSISIAVATTESNPLFTADKAPTVWTSLHIVSHLLHIIHLSMSLIMDFVISFLYIDSLPLYLISFIPKEAARSCNSHSPDF